MHGVVPTSTATDRRCVDTSGAIVVDKVAEPGRKVQGFVATAMWLSLILGVTLSRSLPQLGGGLELVSRAVGVLAAVTVIVTSLATGRRNDAPVSLLAAFALIPALGTVLAIGRGEPGDAVNHLANLLSLAAVGSLRVDVLALSIRRALALLVGASLLLGLVIPVVDPNERAFLRPVYDGRLYGLGGSANVLGMAALMLAICCLITLRGLPRIVGVALGAVGMTAASSQTSLVVLTLVLLTAGALSARRSAYRGVVAVASWLVSAVALTGLAVWLNPPGGRDVGGLISGITFSRRTDVWSAVLAEPVPFLGIGQTEIERFFEKTTIQGAIGITSVHNGLIDAYLRDGVPGLAAALIALSALAVLAWRAHAGVVALPAVALVVVSALEVAPTHVPWFAMFLGLVVIALTRSGHDAGGDAPQRDGDSAMPSVASGSAA